uniref:Uncharacterized protein n=1 Tax=Kalanchoe fedtschenkoi TaxID=63787 RepID=A0A7N0RGA8_KALFE
MNWVFFVESVKATTFSPLQQPDYLYDSSSASYTSYTPPAPPSNDDSTGFNLNSKVSPSILLIIIILAIIFFVSGLLHLLVRFLTSPPTRDPDDSDNVTAFQGQLQQLFHLHDAGVDQSFIDTLPVFNYKAIIGLKNPFDCAVCLCEFEEPVCYLSMLRATAPHLCLFLNLGVRVRESLLLLTGIRLL